MAPTIQLLLVEDSKPEQVLIKDIFSDSAIDTYSIRTAVRLSDAVSILQKEAIDIVLLDLALPDSDGLETIDGILQTVSDIPVIVLTGTDDLALGREIIKRGAQDFLAKGSGAEMLLPRICLYTIERYRSLEKVRSAETFLRGAIDSLPANIAIVDRQGTIVQVNRGWREFAIENNGDLGAVCEGANYFTSYMSGGDETAEEFRHFIDNVQHVFDGELESYEMEYPCDSPEKKRWFQLRVTPFKDTSRGYAVFSHYDITARKEMENALEQSKNFLQTIFDTSPNLIFVKDGQRRYVMVNRALARIYGLTYAEILGKTDHELLAARQLDAEQAAHFEVHDRQVIAEQRTIVIDEESLTDIGGNTRWYRTIKTPMVVPGSQTMLLGIAIDITKDIENRKKIRDSEKLMTTVLNAMHLGIILLDEELRVVWANDRAKRDMANPETEAIGRPCNSIWHLGEACLNCPARKSLRSGKVQIETYKISEQRALRITGCPIFDEKGEVSRVVSIAEDISERLSLERQLRQAQKMESLGTLAGGISHDFNNILTAIIGFTELGLGRTDEGDEIFDDLMEVHKAGLRARDLVHQILTFSRQVEQELKPLDISIVIKEALKLLRSTLPASIELEQYIPTNLGQVIADPTQIHQVIMNLCTNAAHAMIKQGGTLKVTLAKRDITDDDVVEHETLLPGMHLELKITDTGDGIPGDILTSIFDPYFTTKSVGEGTGLGLAVVHGIVKDYGGEIQVRTAIGKGTTFIILLPTHIREEDIVNSEHIDALPHGSGETILVVDDEPAILLLCEKLLTKAGYNVHTEKDPRTALQNIIETPERYDLLLSDITMPYLQGDKLAFEARRLNEKLPIILMSGNIAAYNQNHHLHGSFELIEKPLEKGYLLEKVTEVLSKDT